MGAGVRDSFFDTLLAIDVVPRDDLESWWRATSERRAAESNVRSALLSGALADRVGYAFAGGYAAALRALCPNLPDLPRCLSATEAEGNHPRAIRTELTPDGAGFRLTGSKKWATLGSHALEALVVAKRGEAAGRPVLAVARVRLDSPGVSVRVLPPTPFVPEIPHAEIDFENVRVAASDLLPGDGYDDYLKPFRTVEDVHVHAALLGYLLGLAKRGSFPAEYVERLLAAVAAAEGVAAASPRSFGTHLALAGLLRESRSLAELPAELWARVAEDEAKRFERDRPLFRVAAGAREARARAARERLGIAE